MVSNCKSCGGVVNRQGHFYVCEFCGNKWEIDSSNDVHAVDRANAWRALRDGDFEKAAELFEEILTKEVSNHEAYWGLALARGGIVYVTDLQENKKVPTCNNITEESFTDDHDVQKAISLAPADIAESYWQQAAYIEQVRIEWLEKASKEPAYDVFISFKDSDRENGIERTQDSIDAQDLYNALVAEGYQVFFSRISLRDKIAEQYEPYIYNAIKTAKVMIVFGEKPEYFSSVWIKNEWSRFKNRIANGEKHKNSLVVVYKNLNPGDLPVVLRSRQCLNMADMTFLSDLNRHIQRVIAESQKDVHIEKITIQGGQVAKKATTLNTNSLQIRQVGQGAIVQTDINEQQRLELLKTFLSVSQWNDAVRIADDILFGNPNCAEAMWYKLMAEKKANDASNLVMKFTQNDEKLYFTIEKILDCASKDFAASVLHDLYVSAPCAVDGICAMLLERILPYAFENRQQEIDICFRKVVDKALRASFEVLLTTLREDQVDDYIRYHLDLAKHIKDEKLRKAYWQKVLEVDEGNLTVLENQFEIVLRKGKSVNEIISKLESYLKFAPDPDAVVVKTLAFLSQNGQTIAHDAVAQQLLRYYSGDIRDITDVIVALAERLIQNGSYESAEYFLQLAMSKDQTDPRLFWDLCLVKVRARTEDKIVSSKILLSEQPEYTKYLTMVDSKRQLQCIRLSEKQQKALHNERVDQWWKVCQNKAGIEEKGGKVQYQLRAEQLLINLPEYKQLLKNVQDPARYVKIANDQIDYLRQKKVDLELKQSKQKRDLIGNIFLCGFFSVAALLEVILLFALGAEYGLETGALFLLLLGAVSVGFASWGGRGIVKGKDTMLELNRKLERLNSLLETVPASKGSLWQ